MAQERTAGFDMLVQVSEAELNAQIEAAVTNGEFFASSLSAPVNAMGITGALNLNFGIPTLDMDRPRPNVGLSIPFVDSELAVVTPLPVSVAPLAGTIVVVAPVRVQDNGGSQRIIVDLATTLPSVTVGFDAATVALLTPVLDGFGITIDAAQNLMAAAVAEHLRTGIGEFPLSPDIQLPGDGEPTSPTDLEVTTVNDNAAADRDALTIGIRTSAATGGNINAINQSFINGNGAMLMLSNFWLLARAVRPIIAAELEAAVSDFDTPLRLNRSIPVPGSDATLREMEAHVEGDRIRVTARATDSGFGWTASSTIAFFIDLRLEDGEIIVDATEPEVDTDVDLEWWVWLASLGLGALFGGVAGVVIAALVTALVKAIAEGIANSLVSGAFNDNLSDLPTVPLGPLGNGMTLADLQLDDLELRGPVMRSLRLPVVSDNDHGFGGAWSVDLDTGSVQHGTSVRPSTDLSVGPRIGVRTENSTGLTLTGQAFGSLTPRELSRMAFAQHAIAFGNIPVALPFSFIRGPRLRFGVRTNQGRYARVETWRDGFTGEIHLRWTTFDRPAASLDIATNWGIVERGEETVTEGCHTRCVTTEVARRVRVQAWPKLMAFPINYEWCLCGTVLKEGEGTVESPLGALSYKLQGRDLVIHVPMGQAVLCELCVSAIDARGHELFTCVELKRAGRERICRPRCERLRLRAIEMRPLQIKEPLLLEKAKWFAGRVTLSRREGPMAGKTKK